jgi:hypothetical protein
MTDNAQTAAPEIDLGAIQNEVAGLSQEQLMAEVLKTRVRQKVQQKKQQGSGAQKAYQLKQREKFKLMKAQAIKLGIWDKINEEAEAQAEAKLGEEETPEDEEVTA